MSRVWSDDPSFHRSCFVAGIMTIASWIGNLAVVSSFLSAVNVLGIGGAFGAYSVCLHDNLHI